MHYRGNSVRASSFYKKILYLVSGVILFGLSEVRAQVENYNDWTGHLQITINTTTLGLSGSCVGFPLLLRLNSSNFPYFSQTLSGGADIRFSKANYASPLSYEIERWDAVTGNAEIWVKVDTILQNSATQYIMMHWGKSGVYDSSKGSLVFPSSNGFLATYHLGGDLASATGANNGITDNGTVDTATGIIGRARAFNGSSQFFQAGDLQDRSSGAVSFWFRPKATFNSSSTTQGIYGKKDDDNIDATLSLRGSDFGGGTGSTGCIVAKIETSGTNGYYNNSSTTSWDAGVWYHIAWSWNGSTDSLYVNGTLQTAATCIAALAGNQSDEIGRSHYDVNNVSGGGPKYFNGTLDEFRIDYFSRSAKWSKLSYETQRPDQSVITFSLPDNEDYASWPYHTDIAINTTSSGGGANLPSGINVYNFPLLIRLNPANFTSFGQTLPGGADIRFAKSNGTHFPYEIERWVDGPANSDTAEIWVRIDTVFPQNSTQFVRMYWGNSSATSRPNPSAVFSVAYGYSGAWHLNETPGAAGSIKDRTSNGYNGTSAGGMGATNSVSGVIGKALDFDGTDDHIALPSIPTDFTGGLTISGWMQFHTFKSFSRLIDFSENGQDNDNIFVVNTGISNGLRFGLLTGSTQYLVDTSGFFTANSWDYVTCVYTGAQQAVYRNGVLVKSVARTNALANVTRTTNFIARSNWPADGYYDGLIDELQVSNFDRSASSIKLAYETQKPGGTAVVVCFPATITQDPVNATVNRGDPASFSVTATGNTVAYQWQRRPGGSATWATVTSNGTAATYTFTTAEADTNSAYRCVVSGCSRPDTSVFAVLTVCVPLAIGTQPQPAVVTVGDTATFSVIVTGSRTRQWQRSTGGGAWSNVTAGVGGTTATYKFRTDSSDTNRRFRCVLTGNCGARDSTGAAALSLCFLVSITGHPANAINVAPDQEVTFSVQATGLGVSYQWEKSTDGGTVWTAISGATGNEYTLTVAADDDGSKYRCKAFNTCNSANSNAASLTVCAPPSMVLQPGNRSVIEGQTATFSISATGTNRSYQWIKKVGGGIAWDTVSGAIDTFCTMVTKASDHASDFRCIVRGTCGACTSSVATLIVYHKVKAYFAVSDSLGALPLDVRFTDSSSGAISKWKWSFGDGEVDSADSSGTVLHTYDSAKVYTVTLTVSGPGGIDSMKRTITVYPIEGNPVVITGRYISATSVELLLKNYSGLKIEFPPPFVTDIRVWNRINALPANTADADTLKTYTIAALKARGAEYRDTVAVDALAPPDSAYGFMTEIVWNDNSASPFAPINGCLVLMRDTAKPVNPLVFSGRYAPWDTVFFRLDSASKIDTARADSVALWFGMGTDTVPDFSSQTNIRWWSAREVVQGVSGSAFSYLVKSDQFNTERKLLYCAIMILGKNKLRSPVKSVSFTIGRIRPSNPIVLKALALNANSIRLGWNKLNPDSVEKVRIYYRTGGEFGDKYDFSNVTPRDSVVPAPGVSDTVKTVYRLGEKTRYYFVAQIYRQGMWSRAVRESKATDSTLEADSSTIVNAVRITDIRFDTSTNRVRINWDLDTIVDSGLQIGVSYSVERITPSDSLIKQAIDVDAESDSAEIDFGEDLLFDTTFTCYLWLKRSGEKWARPTDKSTDTVQIPSFVWQRVRYSVLFGKNDTTHWVNSRIRFVTNLVVSQNDAQNYVGTIRRYDGDEAGMRGFIAVGQTFRFTEKQSSMPLAVGLKCYKIPAHYTLRDARMYRWNGDNWMLDRSTSFDTVNKVLSVRTSELDEPFAAMIDTLHPEMTLLNDTIATLERDQEVSDTILVSDNIGNPTWSFRCIEGGRSLAASDSSQRDTLAKRSDTACVVIARTLVNEENGVRAAFIVGDGRHSDTMVLSRRVIRAQSDVTPIARELSWVPLRVTAELDTPDARRLWRMVDTAASDPEYDNRKIRLFCWHPYSANADDENKWLEYAPDRDSIFEFRAGRLFWVKLRSTATFQFGRALTMPLHDTVAIPLNSGEWTDFALPFRFDIRIGDILAATRSRYEGVDSLQFYRWDTTKTTYKGSPFYLDDLRSDGLADTSAVVSSRDQMGYTVYNPLSEPITLRIPPIPLAMSAIGGRQKTARTCGWSVRVTSRALDGDGGELPAVYCVYAPERAGGEKYLPMPPTFHEVSIGVYEDKTGRVRGHKILRSLADGGGAFLLAFSNSGKDARTIQFGLDRLGSLPDDFKTAIYNPLRDEIAEVAGDAASVTIDAGGREYRWVFVGSAGYIGSAAKIQGIGRLAFLKPYPNPVRGFMHLRYTLPFAGVSRVDFTIVDIRGRVVWQKTIREKSVVGGGRSCVWNGSSTSGQRIASGLYVIKMTAYDLKHKPLASFDERVTVIR